MREYNSRLIQQILQSSDAAVNKVLELYSVEDSLAPIIAEVIACKPSLTPS